MTEEQFERFVHKHAAEHHRPPETPREAMWAAIQDARRQRRPGRRFGRAGWVWWAAGVAAALIMGVAIGRFSVGPGERPATVEAPVAAAGDIRVAYQWVAAEHLGRVETFLTGFQVDARSGRPVSGAGTSAYELLSMTRVFLDSPSTEDVQLRALLEDIELVLAQIAHYGDQAPGVELDLIDESIEHRSVLFRLRTVMGAMPTGLTRQGVL